MIYIAFKISDTSPREKQGAIQIQNLSVVLWFAFTPPNKPPTPVGHLVSASFVVLSRPLALAQATTHHSGQHSCQRSAISQCNQLGRAAAAVVALQEPLYHPDGMHYAPVQLGHHGHLSRRGLIRVFARANISAKFTGPLAWNSATAKSPSPGS
jgi:hypothetical protein